MRRSIMIAVIVFTSFATASAVFVAYGDLLRASSGLHARDVADGDEYVRAPGRRPRRQLAASRRRRQRRLD